MLRMHVFSYIKASLGLCVCVRVFVKPYHTLEKKQKKQHMQRHKDDFISSSTITQKKQ